MKGYDIKKMQLLLHDFYNLTGIKICIYDNEEHELCFYPEKLTPFCRALREEKMMDERCRECDRNAFTECKATHRRAVYTCHAGLIECFSPILCNNQIIGYIVIGQIRSNSHTFHGNNIRLAALYEQLPSISEDKIDSAIRILDACAGYEYLKSLVTDYDRRIDARIAFYIEEHLNEKLSINILCHIFHFSRVELYAVFKEYFSSTPADFIKERRLQKAYHLLKQTHLPVNKIAVLCGIHDYNYFSKQFKKKFNICPTQIRKQQD